MTFLKKTTFSSKKKKQNPHDKVKTKQWKIFLKIYLKSQNKLNSFFIFFSCFMDWVNEYGYKF